jgi:hypothetical protein
MPNLGWRRGNRGDALWLRGKSVPRGATRINENGMAFEDAVAEVSLRGTARCAAFRPSCGARACRRPVPSRSKSSTSSDGTTTLRHLAADLLEMQVHRLGVGIRTTAAPVSRRGRTAPSAARSWPFANQRRCCRLPGHAVGEPGDGFGPPRRALSRPAARSLQKAPDSASWTWPR